ncbi:hypothetical protein KGV31_002156 [Vibrio parahaemolyticus]|nr:hypothetical protein [Vibrio parahaemolyticus]EHU0344299.1 hypothetical protein [Vibrio parahaemolyticus]EHU0354333.1 hypothetical protein [Vibrio parahaemolyticus]
MWYYNNELIKDDFIPNGYRGFVYVLKDRETGLKYIGKKDFWCKKKGVWAESDWRTYQGSSDITKKWVNPIKMIIAMCFKDAEMNYKEIELQIKHEALLRSDYVNYCIGDGIKIGRIPDYMMK